MKLKSQNSKGETKIQNSKLFNFNLWFLLFIFTFLLLNISCAKEGLGIGDKAPDFTLDDLAGNKVSLSDTVKSNKATLLVFWATWCPYCREEVPELIKLKPSYEAKGYKIVAIDIGESQKKVDSFVKQNGINYTVLLDTENRIANQYGVMGIPANILLAQDGTILYRGTTAPPESALPK
ncbi:MAG: TlpA disulfide reductase family protein [Candidatus Omnitrophica bacterium]|nr:TlpA disulfide reductase family protein [Candidatus Omnitrophota bacterium]